MSYKLIDWDVSGTLHDEWGNSGLYQGAKELITYLFQQGIEQAIATNLGRYSTNKFVEINGLSQYITNIKTADDGAFKPAPEMLQSILLETGHDACDTLMIGDSIADIEMARRLNIDSCAACWGEGVKERLISQNPTYLANSFKELKYAGMCFYGPMNHISMY